MKGIRNFSFNTLFRASPQIIFLHAATEKIKKEKEKEERKRTRSIRRSVPSISTAEGAPSLSIKPVKTVPT